MSSGSQCKFNSYCGLWCKEVCKTVFHTQPNILSLESIWAIPLRREAGKKKKKFSEKRRGGAFLQGGGWKVVSEQNELFWEDG